MNLSRPAGARDLRTALLTVGYLISRGLAKAGSRTRDNDPRTNR